MERAGDAVTGVIGPVFVALASCLLALAVFTFCELYTMYPPHTLLHGFASIRGHSPDSTRTHALYSIMRTPGD